MTKNSVLTVAVGLLLLCAHHAEAVVSFEWATIGDINNPADTLVMNKGPCDTPGAVGCEGDMTSGYGSVGYEYQIAKHHVTMSQYAEFLNAVDPDGTNSLDLYDENMEEFIPNQQPFEPLPTFTGGIDFDESPTAVPGSKYTVKSGQENLPATWISWVDAARFANWLHNGQGTGDTESGVYNAIPTGTNDPVPTREEGATFFLPSEDEFYKAAYYNPTLNGGTGGYTEYGVGNTAPIVEGPAGGSTSANYSNGAGSPADNTYWQSSGGPLNRQIVNLTDVGAYTNATSHYGLFDVDGNATQWMETSKENPFNSGQDLPIARGGSWLHGIDGTGAAYRPAQFFATGSSSVSSNSLGIRIARLVDSVSGDFDNDGDVDGQDFLEWQRSDGTAAGLAEWQAAYPAGSLAAVASVPEPASIAMLLVGLVVGAGRRQR
jgi:formylglycine-generating enzyme required for sulfatase activity